MQLHSGLSSGVSVCLSVAPHRHLPHTHELRILFPPHWATAGLITAISQINSGQADCEGHFTFRTKELSLQRSATPTTNSGQSHTMPTINKPNCYCVVTSLKTGTKTVPEKQQRVKLRSIRLTESVKSMNSGEIRQRQNAIE